MPPISDLSPFSTFTYILLLPSFQSPLLSRLWFLFLYRPEFLLLDVCCIVLLMPFHVFLIPFSLHLSCLWFWSLFVFLPGLSVHPLSDASLLSLFCPLKMIQWIGVVSVTLTQQGTIEHWIRTPNQHSQLIITHMVPIQLASICFLDCQGQNLRRDITS